MCIIFYLVVINSFRMVYCEWIQISQSSRGSDKVHINQSSIKSNGKSPTFDYSKYKDFFSVIEPEIDFVKDFESSHQHIIIKSDDNESTSNEFHAYPNSSKIFEQPFDQHTKNELPTDSSKVSAFSEFHNTKNRTMTNPLNVNKSKNQPEIKSSEIDTANTQTNRRLKASENQAIGNQMKIVLKRVEFKPFNFDGVFKFFANIQQSFSLDPSAGIQSKIGFLENFKNTLLNNIG